MVYHVSPTFRNGFPFPFLLFTGILGTAVQDQQGRTRRDISTIAHIMNDLLQAAPFYKQHVSPLCCNHHRGTTRHRAEAAGGRASRGVTQPQEKPMRYPGNHQPQGKGQSTLRQHNPALWDIMQRLVHLTRIVWLKYLRWENKDTKLSSPFHVLNMPCPSHVDGDLIDLH